MRRPAWRYWARVASDVGIGAMCFAYARHEPLLLVGLACSIVNLALDAHEGK